MRGRTVDRSRPVGMIAERAAARWCGRRGWTVIARNLRRAGAEADLVLESASKRLLVVVEVKALGGDRMHPAERVDAPKRRRLERLGASLLSEPRRRGWRLRFDVLALRPRPWARPLVRHPALLRLPVLGDLAWRVEHIAGAWREGE
ncbi:MAG TPA: YraN family protein [Phycisphaerales bacterium]|nr:YraN family protein [Phycisphaerales bacterium]HMP38062.1 YraN family protein [Phycisphaerales bacterium]